MISFLCFWNGGVSSVFNTFITHSCFEILMISSQRKCWHSFQNFGINMSPLLKGSGLSIAAAGNSIIQKIYTTIHPSMRFLTREGIYNGGLRILRILNEYKPFIFLWTGGHGVQIRLQVRASWTLKYYRQIDGCWCGLMSPCSVISGILFISSEKLQPPGQT